MQEGCLKKETSYASVHAKRIKAVPLSSHPSLTQVVVCVSCIDARTPNWVLAEFLRGCWDEKKGWKFFCEMKKNKSNCFLIWRKRAGGHFWIVKLNETILPFRFFVVVRGKFSTMQFVSGRFYGNLQNFIYDPHFFVCSSTFVFAFHFKGRTSFDPIKKEKRKTLVRRRRSSIECPWFPFVVNKE